MRSASDNWKGGWRGRPRAPMRHCSSREFERCWTGSRRIEVAVIPDFTPMRLAVRTEPFDHSDWLYELKLDGFRALAVIESGTCRLVSRKAHVYQSFPGLCSSLAQIPHEAVLDGEIVCLDPNGRPQFDSLFYRRGHPYFYAFDVPYLDG